jgi:pimeloyl-ACP methyl ester carboxylesterase
MTRVLVLFISASACAAPCITPTGCSEWIALGGGPGRTLVYRSHPMDTKSDKITRALIVVHGAGRNADDYFRTGVAAAFLAGALEDTVVISPRFASNEGRGCTDKLAANEINWRCGGDSWRSGGTATSNDQINSYDLMDEILRRLARKDVFPNLKAIVVSGHSAGGQYVTRYQMANQVHEQLGIPVTYVVSNPSSYAYPDANRPDEGSSGFHPFSDSRNCTTFDKWPYGLENRTGGYTAKIGDDQLKKQLAARPAVYLLGELDIMPVGGFDSSCPAMAQGPTRLARGQAFANYVNQKYGAKHKVTVIPLCGHNARCMFTADPALPILFPPE